MHDGVRFGRQELYDGHLHLTTTWTKRHCHGCSGGDWALQVHGRYAVSFMSGMLVAGLSSKCCFAATALQVDK